MRTRNRAGLSIAPLFLRLSLATVFLWAGLGKFMARIEVSGQDAAILANYGLLPNPHAPARRPGAQPQPQNQPPANPPAQEESQPEGPASPPVEGSATSRAFPAVADPTLILHLERSVSSYTMLAVANPSGGSFASPLPDVLAQDEAQPTTTPDDVAPDTTTTQPKAEPSTPPTPPTPPHILATAVDFPNPLRVRRYASIVLMLHHAMAPGLDPEDSSPRMALWPDFDTANDYDPWPVRLAWAASLTEVIGGALILLGLLTRFAAIGVAGVMLGAIWLTTVGPALQSGNTALGFLPNSNAFDIAAWTPPLFQLTVLLSALALLFVGPGMLSFDRLLLGSKPSAEAPAKPAKPAKKDA